jgi:thioredoxin 2
MSAGPAPRVVACSHCGQRNRVPPMAHGTPRCGNCHEPLPWVVDADDDSFAAIAEGATVPVLVDIWAPWCGPCRQVSPALEQLASEKAGRLKLVKVDADSAPKISARFGVQAIPTLVVMNNGEVLGQQVGAAPAATLRAWLEQTLVGSNTARQEGK